MIQIPSVPAVGALVRFVLLVVLTRVGVTLQVEAQQLDTLEQHFAERRGQLQVGGPFVGIEFHHSRPVPSRISFYYPVANSIDLSTDYWRRDESMPMSVIVSTDSRSDTLEHLSFEYRSTPGSAVFEGETKGVRTQISYRFAETQPFMAVIITIANHSPDRRLVDVETSLDLTLRTSHTYTSRYPSRVSYRNNGELAWADYDDSDTGPATVFVANVGAEPDPPSQLAEGGGTSPGTADFTYGGSLDPGEEYEIVQLIGASRRDEVEEVSDRAGLEWREEVERYETRVADYALKAAPFVLDDTTLIESARWSKALLQADRHYLDGHVVPMPCPAQYNFFFTHDLLLTDLGAVFFDGERVKRDLLYLLALAKPDSVLPHAYYWKDGDFTTEFAGSDNWNHFWFVLVASSYLRHTGDTETVARLWPMMTKSVRLMLQNERDGLMHAERPDWWDIGHVYGARSYTTILAIRTLRAYAYAGLRLGMDAGNLPAYLELADMMQVRLGDEMWDEEAGYLLNRIEGDDVDRHYYSGSLLAAAYDLVDHSKKMRLLETARSELLDPQLGVRNAMPPDFNELTDVYRFQEGEVGAPYQYANGGVWPQGIAWYVSALVTAGRPEEALAAVKRYLTLDGIRASPNGQPAFFEYRNADPRSPDYGKIDKTTFMWAGGWFLNVLYQMLGVRENAWNISFDARVPGSLENVVYELLVDGEPTRVEITGGDRYFRRITVDGRGRASAVMTDGVTSVQLERGIPEAPYLAYASAIVDSVAFDPTRNELEVSVSGLTGQRVEVRIVSPVPCKEAYVDDESASTDLRIANPAEGVHVLSLSWQLDRPASTIRFQF